MPEGDRHPGRQRCDRCIQRVAAEYTRHTAKHDVAHDASPHSSEGAEHQRSQHTEAGLQRLEGPRRRPGAERDSVHRRIDPVPPSTFDAHESHAAGTDEGGGDVARVSDGDCGAALQEHVADHAATEPGHDGQDDEPHEVQFGGAPDHCAEHGVEENAGQIHPLQERQNLRVTHQVPDPSHGDCRESAGKRPDGAA